MNILSDSKLLLAKQGEEREIEDAVEYDPVDHILNKFGGEIIPE